MKIASPVSSRDKSNTYLDIGHDLKEQDFVQDESGFQPELWFIDNQFSFYSVPMAWVKEHADWTTFDSNRLSIIASGRYINRIATSVVWSSRFDSSTKKEKARERVFSILDKKYDNPKILEY